MEFLIHANVCVEKGLYWKGKFWQNKNKYISSLLINSFASNTATWRQKLVPSGIHPLHEPILTYNRRGPVTFISGQFYNKYSSTAVRWLPFNVRVLRLCNTTNLQTTNISSSPSFIPFNCYLPGTFFVIFLPLDPVYQHGLINPSMNLYQFPPTKSTKKSLRMDK